MKLLYLINGLGAGGAERSLAELLPYFHDAGIETTIACLRARSIGVESDVRLTGCDLLFLPSGGRVAWIRAFRRLIRKTRPDLVHTTLFDSHLVGRLAAAGTGVPVLSSLVGTPYVSQRQADRNLNRFGFFLVQAVDGWTSRHLTTHFHAITRAVSDSYVGALRIAPQRITVVERGRDPVRLGTPGDDRRRRVRDALGIAPDGKVIITVGRQEYPKGQSFLLRAMASLGATHPEAVLLIAGREGTMTPQLRALHHELGLGERVRFLGHRSDVPDLLAASDVFVFPSLFEGLGGALIEAMGLGLPVVASDIPALREVVEEGRSATLVEAASPTAIADAIADLLDDGSKRQAYGTRGMEIFRERFAISRSAERMISLYRRLIVDPTMPPASPAHAGAATGR